MLKLTTTTVVCGVLPGRCSQDGRGKIELCAVCLFITGAQRSGKRISQGGGFLLLVNLVIVNLRLVLMLKLK